MQQRRSCKSETESALSARQSVVRRLYSSWIRFLCSRWEAHGHFIRHWSGPHDTLSLRPNSLARWSLIHGSTRLCMNSITALTKLTPRTVTTTRCVLRFALRCVVWEGTTRTKWAMQNSTIIG